MVRKIAAVQRLGEELAELVFEQYADDADRDRADRQQHEKTVVGSTRASSQAPEGRHALVARTT